MIIYAKDTIEVLKYEPLHMQNISTESKLHIISRQLQTIFEQKELTYNLRSGFRKSPSTTGFKRLTKNGRVEMQYCIYNIACKIVVGNPFLNTYI